MIESLRAMLAERVTDPRFWVHMTVLGAVLGGVAHDLTHRWRAARRALVPSPCDRTG